MPIINQHKTEQLSNLELLAKQVVEGFITGLHKSPFHGFSVEFAEHRLYNKGESTRHIDWKLYARSDKLFIKRYEEETNLRCRIVIDASSSMYYPQELKPGELNKIGFSINAGAALIELLRRQRDAVGLSIFGERVYTHTQTRSSYSHQKMLFNELEKMYARQSVETHERTNVAKALHEVAENTHQRSMIAIFSDMFESSHHFEDLFSALQHLKHKKHEVILFHVTDKKHELNFDFENRPYTFIDLETGEELKLNPTQVKEHYVEQIRKFREQLILKCAQYKIDLVEADIHEGFDHVLLQYLVKRSKMY